MIYQKSMIADVKKNKCDERSKSSEQKANYNEQYFTNKKKNTKFVNVFITKIFELVESHGVTVDK